MFGDAELFDQLREILPHQSVRKDIVPRRHRGMGGEHRGRRHGLQRAVKIETQAHVLAQALQHHERGVTFVDVPHGGRKPQRPQRAHPAHAQHDFLRDAGFKATAVKLVRDAAVVVGIGVQIGVEQQQGDFSQPTYPHPNRRIPAQQVHVQAKRRAARVLRFAEGQIPAIDRQIAELLMALGIDLLPQIAGAIKKPHRHEWQAQIAGRLAVVTGQHAQAAGVERQTFVQAVLGAEIRHQVLVLLEQGQNPRIARLLQIARVRGEHRLVFLQEHRVGGGR